MGGQPCGSLMMLACTHWQIDHDLHLEKLDNRDDW